MAEETNDPSGPNDSSTADLTPLESATSGTDVKADGPADPNDEIPVPIAMWPSEIDERAQVVEALRGNGPPPRTDTQVDPA